MLKLIIFDFDGVIVDSTKHNISFANSILEHFGKLRLNKNNEKDAYTLTTKQFYKKYLKDINVIRAIWFGRKLFRKTLNEFKTAHGLKKTLSKLKKKYKLAIATNRADETYTILKNLNLIKYFDYVLTADHIDKPKPNPDAIKKVMNYFKAKPSETVYVGDTSFDSKAAKRAGVVSIIIKNKKDGGDYRINNFSNIIKVVNEVDKQ